MDIYLKAHIKALTENLELMNVAFIVALFADCVWITSDIVLNGFSYLLFSVCGMLWASLALVGWAFIRYHLKQAKILMDKELRLIQTEVEEKARPTEEELEKAYQEYTDSFDRWSKGW